MYIMNNIFANTLSADIEKKPGPRPVYVDPSKTCTIAGPYSQGHELLFGQNARQLCCNEFVLFDLQQETRNQFCK